VLIPSLSLVGAALASSVGYTMGILFLGWLFHRDSGMAWSKLLFDKEDWKAVRATVVYGVGFNWNKPAGP
jgi:Na+-driven multidrug efflux pump